MIHVHILPQSKQMIEVRTFRDLDDLKAARASGYSLIAVDEAGRVVVRRAYMKQGKAPQVIESFAEVRDGEREFPGHELLKQGFPSNRED